MAVGNSGGMRIPTAADLVSMWNASGLKEKLIFTFIMLQTQAGALGFIYLFELYAG